jgi:hypothetical protein
MYNILAQINQFFDDTPLTKDEKRKSKDESQKIKTERR